MSDVMPQYDPSKLREAIGKIEDNIKIFEQAIADERTKIKEYQDMITVLERKKMEEEMAAKMEAELAKNAEILKQEKMKE